MQGNHVVRNDLFAGFKLNMKSFSTREWMHHIRDQVSDEKREQYLRNRAIKVCEECDDWVLVFMHFDPELPRINFCGIEKLYLSQLINELKIRRENKVDEWQWQPSQHKD